MVKNNLDGRRSQTRYVLMVRVPIVHLALCRTRILKMSFCEKMLLAKNMPTIANPMVSSLTSKATVASQLDIIIYELTHVKLS